MKKYNPSEIEPKWQKIWDENAEVWQAQDSSEKPKFYTLFELAKGNEEVGEEVKVERF